MNQSKKLADGALLTGVFLVLLLISFFIPFLTIASMFILPIPFIVYTARYDWKPALGMFFVAILLASLFATVFSIPVTVLSGLGGILIGTGIYRKTSPYETWARGTVGFVVGLLFAFLFANFVFQVNLTEEFNAIVRESMESSRQMMKQFGLAGQTEEEFALIEKQIELLKGLLPVGLVIIALLQGFISQWVGYKLLNRLEKRNLHFPPFRDLQFPVIIVWVYFIALIFTFFQLDPNSILFVGVQNVLMLAGLLMVIQGFSFIFFYAHQKKWPKAIPVFSIVLTVLFPFLLLYLIRILGIIDIGFRLRERMEK